MPNKTLGAWIAAAGLTLMASVAIAAPADIDQAKSQCIIGERIDGYLGIIDDGAVDDALRRNVREINQRRNAAYADLAAKNGVTLAVAAATTAERLINGAPSGHCVQNERGEWVRKP